MNRLETLKKVGEIHLQVQEYTKSIIQPNITLFDLAEKIEHKIKELTCYDVNNPKKGGVAFPTGLSINECAAHWSPNPITSNSITSSNLNNILHTDDLIKIDFGVHLNGHIIDGAFSVSFSEKYSDAQQQLIRISQEATECGIRNSGPDAILGEIGASIQEIIESYEINEKKVKSTIDLCGHNIGVYHIHNGKAVPNIKIRYDARMEIDEEYAIETFPTTGTGKVKTPEQMNSSELAYFRTTNNPPDCSHYMIQFYDPSAAAHFRATKAKNKLSTKNILQEYREIYSQFNTLAFCPRWIPNARRRQDRSSSIWTPNPILLNKGLIQSYPPLYDVKGSFVAQTEKSIYITEFGKIVLN